MIFGSDPGIIDKQNTEDRAGIWNLDLFNPAYNYFEIPLFSIAYVCAYSFLRQLSEQGAVQYALK